MKKITLILSACLLSMPVMADKPSWAGSGGKQQEEWPERIRQPASQERDDKRGRDDRDGREERERYEEKERYEQRERNDQREDRYRQDDRQDRDRRRDDDRIDGFLPLTERERQQLRDRVLEERYGVRSEPGKMKSLPPGLQKKLERGGELPPGWYDKVHRGEVLDADLYRRGERLPREYMERLGYGSEASELIILGDKVVRVAQGRGTVLDVIDLTDKALEMLGR